MEVISRGFSDPDDSMKQACVLSIYKISTLYVETCEPENGRKYSCS